MSWIDEIYGTDGFICGIGDKVQETRSNYNLIGTVVGFSNKNPSEPLVKFDLTDDEIYKKTGMYSRNSIVKFWTPQGGIVKL